MIILLLSNARLQDRNCISDSDDWTRLFGDGLGWRPLLSTCVKGTAWQREVPLNLVLYRQTMAVVCRLEVLVALPLFSQPLTRAPENMSIWITREDIATSMDWGEPPLNVKKQN